MLTVKMIWLDNIGIRFKISQITSQGVIGGGKITKITISGCFLFGDLGMSEIYVF